MDFTGPAVWRGLAGFHLLRDDEEESLGLPSGDRDIPLMICDRSFDADGAFRYPARDPSLTFVQIGSDGGLLAAPLRHESIPIAQAERFDVVLDFSGHRTGTEITLVDRLGDGRTEEVMRFRVSGQDDDGARGDAVVPDRLADLGDFDALDEADAEVTRTFDFDRAGERDGKSITISSTRTWP